LACKVISEASAATAGQLVCREHLILGLHPVATWLDDAVSDHLVPHAPKHAATELPRVLLGVLGDMTFASLVLATARARTPTVDPNTSLGQHLEQFL
jgi:hypothetical protein